MLLLLQNICSFCQNCCFSLSVAELVRCFCRQVHWRALHCEALQCIALWSASTLWKALHCGSVGCGEDAMCILKHQCIVEQSSTYRYRELESNIFGTGIKYIWGRICIVSWYGNLHTYKSRHCIIVDVAVTNPILSYPVQNSVSAMWCNITMQQHTMQRHTMQFRYNVVQIQCSSERWLWVAVRRSRGSRWPRLWCHQGPSHSISFVFCILYLCQIPKKTCTQIGSFLQWRRNR